MIHLQNISKTFTQGETELRILQNLSVQIGSNQKVAIIGASGSGKSTLLSIMSGMDKPDEGKVMLDEEDLVTMTEEKLCKIRNRKIGVIFQAFELIPSFTALENVLLPLDIADLTDIDKAKQLLSDLGLSHRFNHLPKMLSGGEQQRVAIARALIANPEVIFADEPTGNLDIHTGEKVLDLLFKLIGKYKKTLVLITHDISLSKKMDRVFSLKDGVLHEQA
jgi:putative ABC transport system ATP-binding protein